MSCGGDVQVANSTGIKHDGYLKYYCGLIFKGWSKRYICISNNGEMIIKSSQSSSSTKHSWNIKAECQGLRVGQQCTHIAPRPETGADILHIFALTINKRNHFFQANGEENLVEWLKALYEAKGVQPGPPQGPPQGQPMPQGPPPPGFTPSVTGQPVPSQGYAPPQGYPPPPQGYAQPPQGYAPPPQGYAPPPQGYAPPPQGQYPRQYPQQVGYPRQAGMVQQPAPQQRTVIVNQRPSNDGFATGVLTGAMLGGYGYGWGYGGGFGFGHHHYHGFHDHHHHHHYDHHDHYNHHDHHDHHDNFDHHDHHDFGGDHGDYGGGDMGDFGGGDFGGGDFGGGDFGGGDFDGGDF